MRQVDVLVDGRDSIGESPVWLSATASLYWVDANGSTVYWWRSTDGAVGERQLAVEVTALVPRAGGGWIIVSKTGLHSATMDFATIRPLVDPCAGDPVARLNDGVADRWGRVWTGSQSEAAPPDPVGRLYLVDPASGVTEIDDGFAVANGIALGLDGSRAYVCDLFHRRIRTYQLDPESGAIVDQLASIETDGPGYPDGLAMDASGRLWVGYWDGARVDRVDVDGTVLETVSIPATHATRACLGGPDGKQLFVTTGRYDLDADELERRPHSGALFTTMVEATAVAPAEARL